MSNSNHWDSLAANQVARRKGVGSSVIPNVMDFDNPPAPPDEYTASLRSDLGIGPDEIFFLQPTRVVRRKGIEHAIELVKRLGVKARVELGALSPDDVAVELYWGHLDPKGEIREAATRLAFNMADFRSGGAFGRFFNGRSTFDISNDDFVVLELEHLLPKKALFKVVTLQVINAVTMDLYLSDRSDRRLVCFDEAWQFLGESSTLKQVIEEGYRRARKYHGSFTICLQSVLDTLRFGAVGNVIRENSAFKFYLESTAFEEAKNQGVLDYDDFTMQILKSTKSLKPKYSEIFMDTPLGIGVGRLTVDPFSYYAFTSDGEEIAEIDMMVHAGMSYEDAIREMVRKYRGN